MVFMRPQSPIIAPSILSADFSKLGEEITSLPHASWFHVDVMDGHFVPNLSFGIPILKATRQATDKTLDCHLMIDDPDRWALDYAAAGADSVTFHIEAAHTPVDLARRLRGAGVQAGVSIKPGTSIDEIIPMIEEFDLILVMSVEPGFGGQKFMPEVLGKVHALREIIDSRKLSTLIEIDGGIDPNTIGSAAEAGVDAFVAGSAVYGAGNPDEAVQRLSSLAAEAWGRQD